MTNIVPRLLPLIKKEMWICINCGRKVDGVWNKDRKRYEPASHYWKGSQVLDIDEVYCGAECSLKVHQRKLNA